MLETVCYLVVYLAEAFIAWQYCSCIFVARRKERVIIPFFLVGYFGMFLLSFFDSMWINLFTFFGINAVVISLLYFAKKKELIFHIFVLTVVMSIAELAVIAVFQGAFGAFHFFEDGPVVLILIALASKSVYYLLTQILIRIFEKNHKNYVEIGPISTVLGIASAIMMWISLTFIFICGNISMSPQLEGMVIVSAILILAINILIFWIYTYQREKNYEFVNMQLQMHEEKANAEQYKMLLEHREAQNILIHDIKNHLGTVSGLLSSGKIKDAEEFINHLVQMPEFEKRGAICTNPVLNVILSHYLDICKEKNIQLNLDIRKDSVDMFNAEELSALFGNLLDNAIEAAESVPGAYIDLNVEVRKERNCSVITMVNSSREKPKQTDDGKFVSRKKDSAHHGFGMKSVERIVKQHRGSVKAYYDSEEQLFHIVIVVNRGQDKA